MTSPPQSGLYDGFEGYRTPSDEQFADAVKNWLVVLDTNVLLSLYGVHGTTLDDFIRVFEAIGDRLFIPHQVMDEFWRNRRAVIAENQGKHREKERIEEAFAEIRSTFDKWYSRVIERGGKPPHDRIKELDEAVAAVVGYMEQQTGLHPATTPDTPTWDDPVLRQLEPLLESKVGAPPAPEELSRLLRDGEARVKQRIPPGYLDAAKGGGRAAGDFILWHQTIQHAKETGRNVLFVTQDQKEDWWADRGTKSMRARPELVAELRREAGQDLLMVRSYTLFDLSEHLGVEVSKQAIEEARTFEDNPWTPELAARYIRMLGQRNPEHLAMIINAAGDDEGSIDRAWIAELLGRDEQARMSGLTRPFDTVLKALVSRTGMDPVPELPMYPWYVEGSMTHLVLDADFDDVLGAALTLVSDDELEAMAGHLYEDEASSSPATGPDSPPA